MTESMRILRSIYTVDEAAEAEVGAAGAAEALAITVGEENEDFTFAESTEAPNSGTFLDLEDGVTANWTSGVGKAVRVIATAVVDESAALGAVVPTEGDLVDLVVSVNEDVVAVSEEGPSEAIDAAVTFNIDTVIPSVKGGDVIRLALKSDADAEAADYDVAASGEFDLQPA